METLNEDTVQCLFFPSTNTEIEDNYLLNMCNEVNKSIKILCQGYIWHKDEFKFNVSTILDGIARDLPCHLVSHTCFGDNIEDEWFIVYLILEITKIYTDAIVQIKDNDGDFILIEAADYLPQWANPDTTENRVFIYKGHIHLITPEYVNFDQYLSISDALNIVAISSEQTQVIDIIEKTILDRIGNYPHKIQENIHNAVVNIPADLAALLTLEPNLIAPIVTTYCDHDPLEVKTCRNISVDDCIAVKIKFTKCLYSMLVHVKLINNVIAKNSDSTAGNSIGLKLTLGYYMLQKSGKDIFCSKRFAKFLRSLEEKGYFKDNTKGSLEYTKLEINAKNYFLSNECPISLHVCEKIKQLMCTDEFAKVKETLIINNTNSNLSGDNDDWLNIHPEYLNDLLNKNYGKQIKNNDITAAKAITNELSNFLNKSSDFEGVETINSETSHTDDIEFDPDMFGECVEKFLNLLVTNSTDELELDSYFNDDNIEFIFDETSSYDAIDKEIKSKLSLEEDFGATKNILQNIVQSVKEENSSPGPSTTLLRSIGIAKKDILDSDDDEE